MTATLIHISGHQFGVLYRNWNQKRNIFMIYFFKLIFALSMQI